MSNLRMMKVAPCSSGSDGITKARRDRGQFKTWKEAFKNPAANRLLTDQLVKDRELKEMSKSSPATLVDLDGLYNQFAEEVKPLGGPQFGENGIDHELTSEKMYATPLSVYTLQSNFNSIQSELFGSIAQGYAVNQRIGNRIFAKRLQFRYSATYGDPPPTDNTEDIDFNRIMLIQDLEGRSNPSGTLPSVATYFTNNSDPGPEYQWIQTPFLDRFKILYDKAFTIGKTNGNYYDNTVWDEIEVDLNTEILYDTAGNCIQGELYLVGLRNMTPGDANTMLYSMAVTYDDA